MVTAVQYTLFILAIILFSIVYPISGYYQKKRVVSGNDRKQESKIKWYRESMIWAWGPTLLIIIVVVTCGFGLGSLGIRPIALGSSNLNIWIVYTSIIVYLFYLGYNIYSIIVLKYSKESREHSMKQLPEEIIAMLPVTSEEKRTWIWVSITAGISEEIQYRGYLFFAIPFLFPEISIWFVLAISTFLFGIGHIYQGKSVIRPTLAGLLFGFLYIIFDSLIPVIILHIIQDLVVKDLLDE